MALERDKVRKIQELFAGCGGYVLKVHGSGYARAGEPDLIGCYLGRCIAIEAKRDPGMQPSRIQQHRLAAWKRAGAVVLTNPTVDEVRAALERIRADLTN